jgi:hypothetical protein
MNGLTRNSGMVEVERLLRALADDDSHQQAPLHVHAAVMRTWDAGHVHAHQRRRRPRSIAALVAVGSIAAALIAAVVMSRAPAEPDRHEPLVAPSVEPPVAASMPASHSGTPAETHRPRPRRAAAQEETRTSRDEPGVVLVADPILDASAMSIVRVRVPRAALGPLGIPLVEPNDGGSVDLELLVGEDGVARTIRRAVPVAVQQE